MLLLTSAVTFVKCLSFTLKFLCNGQGDVSEQDDVRQANLYVDRTCFS